MCVSVCGYKLSDLSDCPMANDSLWDVEKKKGCEVTDTRGNNLYSGASMPPVHTQLIVCV